MHKRTFCWTVMVCLSSSLLLTGCKSKSHAGQEAKKGAAYGALGGAVSGFFWGLFTGNPVERAAQGAVVGGATGATMGAVHGSGKDRELKAEFGETNYKGLMALVERDYPNAREYAAQTAAQHDVSSNQGDRQRRNTQNSTNPSIRQARD